MLSLTKAFKIALIIRDDDLYSFASSRGVSPQMISSILHKKSKSDRLEKDIRSYTHRVLRDLKAAFNSDIINIDKLIL